MEDWRAALTDLGPPCSRRSGLAALSHKPLKPISSPFLPILRPSLRTSLANLHKSELVVNQRASQVCQAAAESVYSDDDFKEYVVANTISDWHPTGTCAMGGSLGSQFGVVDERLKVYGTTNLRCIDAVSRIED